MFLRWGKFRGRVKGFKHWIQQWHQTFLLLLGGSSSRCSRCTFLRRNFTWCKVVFLVDPGHWIQVPNESHMDIALTWVDVSCSPCFARSSGVDIFDFRNKFGLPALCCPELPGAEAEPQVPNPLAMLPPLAWSVKPLIFSWNSRTLWDDFLWSWELLGLLKLLSLSFICTVMGSPGQGMMFWHHDLVVTFSLAGWLRNGHGEKFRSFRCLTRSWISPW